MVGGGWRLILARFLRRLRSVMAGPGGGSELIAIAYPLILGQLSFTLQMFVDRLFLTWYSPEAMAGAATASFVVWTVVGVFVGTGEYLTTFVAQYLGAGRVERIGSVLWQGFYFSLVAGLLLAGLATLAEPVFTLAGHPAAIRAGEVTYTRILLLGAFPAVAMATLSTFFAGLGRTRVILVVNLAATVVNCVLDYLWIFGDGRLVPAGVAGAAWATVASQAFGTFVFAALILAPDARSQFRTLAGWRFEAHLFLRLLRFGLPSGLQFGLELFAFSIFMLIVGRLGADALAASAIAFNLNMIVFMPMLGLGVGVSALVGKYLGAERPELAERVTRNAFWLSLLYMTGCGLCYVLAPHTLLALHAAGSEPAAFARVSQIAVVLLRFVAVYSIFDMMNVIFAAALRGAGDTTYPMLLELVLSWLCLLGPAFLLCEVLGFGVYAAWSTVCAYVVALGLLMWRRFRAGRWRGLRVIERAPAPLAAAV